MEIIEQSHRAEKTENTIFQQSHSSKNVKGDPLGFFNIHYVAKYFKKLKGGPFGDIEKISKKSHSAEKIERVNVLVSSGVLFYAKKRNNCYKTVTWAKWYNLALKFL